MGLITLSQLVNQTTSQCQLGDKDSTEENIEFFSNMGRMMQEHVYMPKLECLASPYGKVRKVSPSLTYINKYSCTPFGIGRIK